MSEHVNRYWGLLEEVFGENILKLKYHLTKEAMDAGCYFTQPKAGDVGYDICASRSLALPRGYAFPVPTGLHLEIPDGYVGIIKDRSGFATKHDVYVHAGVIDPGYRGEIKVLLHNSGHFSVDIDAGDRIAQIVFVPYLHVALDFRELDELSDTERGQDGFGSTGK